MSGTVCAAFPSGELSPGRIFAPGLLLKCFVGRSPAQQVSTCFSCCVGINLSMAGAEGKDELWLLKSVCAIP